MAGTPFIELRKIPGVRQEQGWRARVTEASYKSPGGTIIKFDYEDVSRKWDARGTPFDFPGLDGAYVQRTGFGSRVYPVTAYFTGLNCDLEATAFEAALMENGTGELNHPLYGSGLKVVPYGNIERIDRLVTEANQSVVTVEFWTTTGIPYPTKSVNAENEIRKAIANFDVEKAQEFKNRFETFPEHIQAMGVKSFANFLDNLEATLNEASGAIAEKRALLQDQIKLVNRALDVLVGQPLQLAQQVLQLLKAPAEAFNEISDRLDMYKAMGDEILANILSNPAKTIAAANNMALKPIQIANSFHTADLFMTGSIAGQIQAATTITFTSRKEVLDTAAAIDAQFKQVMGWRDAQFAALSNATTGTKSLKGGIDAGSSHQFLAKAYAQTMSQLVEVSFTLFPERVITLDRPRNIIELCAELYQDVSDERLDYLCNTNAIAGDEFLELPAGRRIVYYAAA